ncbi:MAG: alanine racemase [Microcella sp.]
MATIDLAALRANARMLRDRVHPATLMAVVKDDAYGHGLDAVLPMLVDEGVTWFGALDPAVAVNIVTRHPSARAFAWHLTADSELGAAVRAGVDLGVTDQHALERVIEAAESSGRVARVHLQLDTGLHRGGTAVAQWAAIVARAVDAERAGTARVEGIFTHLAEASDADDSRAIAAFHAAADEAERALGGDPRIRHIAASAAAFDREDARAHMVRIGAFVTGIAPGAGRGPADLGVRPVMTLTAEVVSVDGDGTRLAIGGRDGLLRRAEGTTVVLAGHRRRVLRVDPLTTLVEGADAAVGDTAVLWGPGDDGEPTLQELADQMGTIGEELVARLTPRVQRRVVG